MVQWENVRHQVAIAGRVTSGQGGIPGARVEITSAPPALRRRPGVPIEAQTGEDGLYYFLDLPDGQYTLSASLPGQGSRYGTAQVQATVSRDDTGKINLASADVRLPSTTVAGSISGATHSPVAMAEVRIVGTGERAYSDSQGQYALAELEIGRREVLVSARGFQPASKPVTLAQAGDRQTLDFELSPVT